MGDIYDTLIGAAPTDREKAAEIASALRRRRSYGELGMLTGDRVLAPMGQRMVKEADDYASTIQDTRQRDVDNAQTKSYQDAQLGHMGNVLKETIRGRNMADATSRRGQDMLYDAAMARAAAAAAKASKPTIGKLTFADRQKLEGLSNLKNGADNLANSFKDDYTQIASPSIVPEAGQSRLVNTAASLGLGTDKAKEAADWWAQWNLIYTLPQRNATFGATLTPTEKQSWFNSDINPSMDAKQVRSRVKVVQDILKRKGELADKTYKAQGFSPDVIDSYELGGVDPPAGASSVPVPPGGDENLEEAPLTQDEQAELEALRAQLRGRPTGA